MFSTSSLVGGAGTRAMFAAKCFAVLLLTPTTLVEAVSICRRYSASAMMSINTKAVFGFKLCIQVLLPYVTGGFVIHAIYSH